MAHDFLLYDCGIKRTRIIALVTGRIGDQENQLTIGWDLPMERAVAEVLSPMLQRKDAEAKKGGLVL
ncbi:hypothetical protein [Chelativorans salis]|uniref:Uncharacterized protein n=1 Tax=Chelativorans salis TaxID=2978478 RepID=A0ABT2LTU9_9HYPH|nr:hypothetical protein [Chelativorans sp. EGI FJ00035]MCT7377963.1 hypothetical protein [Chelativorans sp. EGI FJ00035]